jgi:predicted dehydrogenase
MKIPGAVRGVTRRRFLVLSGGAVASATTGALWYRSKQDVVRVALVGCGMRGRQLAKSLGRTCVYPRRAEIVAFCDVHRGRAEALRREVWSGGDVTQRYEDVLDRKDVEAVFVVTPEHWHAKVAIDALRAGKHVYLEKPLALTIAEGQRIVRAVEESGRVMQVGTQQRSHRDFQTAVELVRNGRLGRVRQVTITLPVNPTGGPFKSIRPPAELDWERWLGQAPVRDYCPERFEHFRGWYDYSGGSMTDWGAHHLDITQWALEMDHSGPVRASGRAVMPKGANRYDVPKQFEVELAYADGVKVRLKTDPQEASILFEGEAGRIRVNRRQLTGRPVEELSSNPLPEDAVRVGRPGLPLASNEMDHLQDFFRCVREGGTPISDVVSQHRSATACHLANIALRLGREVRWDPETETFPDDAAATAMIDRPQRSPYGTGGAMLAGAEGRMVL